MANYSCYVELVNNSTSDFTLSDSDDNYGHWTSGGSPPSQVKAGTRTGNSSTKYTIHLEDASGAATGTEGYMTYKTNEGYEVKMSFTCPYAGHNKGSMQLKANTNGQSFTLTWEGHNAGGDWIKEGIQTGGHPCYFIFTISD